MTNEDLEKMNIIQTKMRFRPEDLGDVKRIYEKYINHRLKKVINWNCPTCLRQVIDELITYKTNSMKDAK